MDIGTEVIIEVNGEEVAGVIDRWAGDKVIVRAGEALYGWLPIDAVRVKGDEAADVAEPVGMSIVEKIALAIGSLGPDDYGVSNGLPNVKALEAVLGFDITAAQRDEAWKIYATAPESYNE